jgi:hypothetical protein
MKHITKTQLGPWRSLVVALAVAFGVVGVQAQTTVLAVPVTSTPAAPPASAYSASVATDWFSLAMLITQQTPGFSPPVAARALG